MLPININGDPEYATVVLTLKRGIPAVSTVEHVALTSSKSTREPEEEVVYLASANGETGLISGSRGRRLLIEGARQDAVYIYRPQGSPDVAHLVMGSGGYRDLIDHPSFGRGSNLVADWRLFEEVALEEAAEGLRPLAMLAVSDLLEDFQEAA